MIKTFMMLQKVLFQINVVLLNILLIEETWKIMLSGFQHNNNNNNNNSFLNSK